MSALPGSTSVGHSITTFFDAVGQFFSDLAAVHWPALLLGLLFFGINLTLRSRAFYNSLRAAYPAVPIQFWRIWGAYVAAVGFNNVVPARGGDLIKLFLSKSSVPGSRYPTVAAAFFVESIFDASVGLLVLIYAFSQGVFPKPPDFSKLSSFDISYLAEHFSLTLFLITLLAVVALVAFAVLSPRVKAFWTARAPGVHDPQRQAPLPATGRVAAGARVAVPVRRLLVPARGLPRRRLGAERAARVRRQPGGGRRAVHARRRRCPAGPAGEGVRGERVHERRRRLLRRPADRDRHVHGDPRPERGHLHLRLPLLAGGHPCGAGVTRSRARSRAGGDGASSSRLRASPLRTPPRRRPRRARGARARATEAPSAPRARGPPPPGTRAR